MARDVSEVVIFGIIVLFEPAMHFFVWLSNKRERRKQREEYLKSGRPL